MSRVERILEINKIINEAKESPEFEAFRKKLEVIFKKTSDFYKKAAKDMDPEIRDAILQDAKDYERLSRLAKSATLKQIKSAWNDLDTAPRDSVYDIMNKQEESMFDKFFN